MLTIEVGLLTRRERMRNSISGTQITLMVLAEHLALKGNVAECGFVTRSQPALKYY